MPASHLDEDPTEARRRIAEIIARRFAGLVTEETIARAYRVLVPRARGEHVFVYTSNGAIKAVRSCRICGRWTSWCNNYPRTATSYRDEHEHVEMEVAKITRERDRVVREIEADRKSLASLRVQQAAHAKAKDPSAWDRILNEEVLP
jgi:hypothetical protein